MSHLPPNVLAYMVSWVQLMRYIMVAPCRTYPLNGTKQSLNTILDAILIWDFLAVLPQEIELIYLSHEPWTILKCIYILCRYLPIMLWPIIIWTVVVDHTLEECVVGMVTTWQNMIFMILQFLPHCVLVIRTYAYTGRKKKIRILLVLCICTYSCIQVWAYLSGPSRRLNEDVFQKLGRSGCYREYETGKRRFAYAIITGVIMDSISTVLTIIHAMRTMGVDGSLGWAFVRQGLSLFILMFFINILAVVSFIGRAKPWETVTLTMIMLLPNVMACRFILELREITTRKSEISTVVGEFGRTVDNYLAQTSVRQE